MGTRVCEFLNEIRFWMKVKYSTLITLINVYLGYRGTRNKVTQGRQIHRGGKVYFFIYIYALHGLQKAREISNNFPNLCVSACLCIVHVYAFLIPGKRITHDHLFPYHLLLDISNKVIGISLKVLYFSIVCKHIISPN